MSGLSEGENQGGEALLPPWEIVGHGREMRSLWGPQVPVGHQKSRYSYCAHDAESCWLLLYEFVLV